MKHRRRPTADSDVTPKNFSFAEKLRAPPGHVVAGFVFANTAKTPQLMPMLKTILACGLGLSLSLGHTLCAQQPDPESQRALAERALRQHKGQLTIVEMADAMPDFSLLAKALHQSGLATVLSETGPYTIFAPTNAAFEKLSKKERDDLFRLENRAQLLQILQQHVVKGSYSSRQLAQTQELSAETGESLRVGKKSGQPTVGGAALVRTDVAASNGLIHVVDRVLIPKKLPAPSTPPSSAEPLDAGSNR